MAPQRDEAIVLTRLQLRERDLLLVLLTRRGGVQRAVARRARGGHRRLGAVLEPLNLCRMTLFRTAGSDLARIDDAALLRSAFALASQPAAWAAGQVVAELATLYCPEGQRLEASFRLVDHCLGYLLAGGDPTLAAAYAELWFLRLAGVLPDLNRCGECGDSLGNRPWRWDADAGHLCCPRHPARAVSGVLPPRATGWLSQASRAGIAHLKQPPPPEAITWLHALGERYTERQLRSWAFFQQALVASAGMGGPPGSASAAEGG